MGLFKKEKIVYTGTVGEIVRIPCRHNSSKLIFTGTDKEIKILEALMGPKHERNRNNMWNMDYFGFTNMKDASSVSYTTGYTATHTYGNNYTIKENKHSESDYISMKVVVGADTEVAQNKKSNVNKWINAVSKPTRTLGWWIVGILTSPIIVGLFMLVDVIHRLYLNSVKNSCLRKAKKSYKKNGKVIVF